MAKNGNDHRRQPRIVVIGAGMTGILLAVRMQQAGIEDVTIFEKASRLGGTWRENTYPGVACDVPSHMYTYSFAPNPNWNELFASGDEIQAYFEQVASDQGVQSRIHFEETVTHCIFQENHWRVTTNQGREIAADFVFNCTGILHRPVLPDIDGLDRFRGPTFHTARWDHDVELAGKRIGIIGTGATAAQAIPELAEVTEELVVFQRTPQWILPVGNRTMAPSVKRHLRKHPASLRRLKAFFTWFMSQFLTKAVIGYKVQNTIFTWLCKLNLRWSVKDRALRAKLTPDYRVGCKRIIVNTTFYPAIQRPNVSIETEAIEAVSESAIHTVSGKQHALDVLVLATGFDPMAYMRPMQVLGRNGQSIDQAWEGGIKAYRSICLPGFPNNFLMLGPNSPVGNYSVIAIAEVQCDYLLQLIERWRDGQFDTIEPTTAATENFRNYVKSGHRKTVWVGGCNSWYLDQEGSPILWPYSWRQWTQEMATPEMADFNTDAS